MNKVEKLNNLIKALKATPPHQLHQQFRHLDNITPLLLPPMADNAQAASVLIPIILHPINPTILLIERSEHLKNHASQISFPGGKQDETDLNAKACVLREVKEEIGIESEQIEIIAELGQWPSSSGFSISPFVGLLTPPLTLKPSQAEVKSTFELPLEIALERNNYQKKVQAKTERQYYELIYQDKQIWGFTAGILVLLASYFSQIS